MKFITSPDNQHHSFLRLNKCHPFLCLVLYSKNRYFKYRKPTKHEIQFNVEWRTRLFQMAIPPLFQNHDEPAACTIYGEPANFEINDEPANTHHNNILSFLEQTALTCKTLDVSDFQ